MTKQIGSVFGCGFLTKFNVLTYFSVICLIFFCWKVSVSNTSLMKNPLKPNRATVEDTPFFHILYSMLQTVQSCNLQHSRPFTITMYYSVESVFAYQIVRYFTVYSCRYFPVHSLPHVTFFSNFRGQLHAPISMFPTFLFREPSIFASKYLAKPIDNLNVYQLKFSI